MGARRNSSRTLVAAAAWGLVATFAASSVAAFAASSVAADTIYLKSGRVIRTESVRIEGNKVVFSQYGGTLSIPLAAVERIEEDANVGPVARSTQSVEEYRERAAARPGEPGATPGASEVPTGAAQQVGAGAEAVPEDTEVLPWETPEYWIEQIKEVDERIEVVEAQLDRVPTYTELEKRQFFGGNMLYWVAEREKWEGYLERFQARRDELLLSARKAGITPGQLRDGLRKR